MQKPCSISDCPRPHYAKTLCRVHYKRVLKHGDARASEPIGSYQEACVQRRVAKLTGVKRGPYSEAHKEAIRQAKKGRPNGLLGRVMPEETRSKIGTANAGPNSGHWKGDEVGYVALHERVRKQIGSTCTHCETSVDIQAALRVDAEGPIKVGTVGENSIRYSTKGSDYIALCRPCHRAYDGLNWG